MVNVTQIRKLDKAFVQCLPPSAIGQHECICLVMPSVPVLLSRSCWLSIELNGRCKLGTSGWAKTSGVPGDMLVLQEQWSATSANNAFQGENTAPRKS